MFTFSHIHRKAKSDSPTGNNSFFRPTTGPILNLSKMLQRKSIEPEEEEKETVQRKAKEEEKEEAIQRQAAGELYDVAGDEEEQEEISIQRKCAECEKEEKEQVQRKENNNIAPGTKTNPSLTSQLNATKGGGTPLPYSTRAFMENQFNVDFSRVRVHANSTAAHLNRALNAHAFTHGKDIYFNNGQYAPSAPSGKRLLAHELAHVVQQGEVNTPRPGIQRAIVLNERQSSPGAAVREEVLDEARVDEVANNLLGGPLRDLVSSSNSNFFVSVRYRRDLVGQILRQLHRNSQRFYFLGEAELADEVRKRALVSIYMRQSQGSTTTRRAFGYPNRSGTSGCGPRVNLAAQRYWGPVQNETGNYFFNLSSDGYADPYQALVTLFTEQRDSCKRTLIHCDYVVSLIQYRAMAETMGTTRFNQEVQAGRIPMTLKYDGFSDITSTGASGADSASFANRGFQYVTVSGPSDFMLGDHVIMFNHESYDSLNAVKRDPWRLENAIITKEERGENYYQGHGYFSPLPLNHFIRSMMYYYNKKVDEARGLIRSGKRTTLQRQYPSVFEHNGEWFIRYRKLGGACGRTFYIRPLQRVTMSDFSNPFAHPCNGNVYVRRPIESIRNVR